ncbi:MAG: PorT family protein [Flavisolibacter sp.]|nr:PorT family protein [Flavisolibacter sp.]
MKKITLTGLCVMMLSGVLFAQHHAQIGIKGGANFSALSANGSSSDQRTGFNAGLLAHFHVSPHFAVQPEVMYSSQGAEYTDVAKTKLNYINVPVLGQYMFGNGLRLQTGPQVGILTSAESKNGNTETEVKSSFKKTDVSWSFGTSYLTRSNIGIDARYNLGLTDISKNNSDLKNRVWQVGLFYQFR